MPASPPLRPYPGDLLEHLASLLALARRLEVDARSAFDAVAAELHVDQSVLRRRIQTLDAHLGGPLLEGRGARLTVSARGARAVEVAGRVVADLARLDEELAGAGGIAPVRIGCTGTVTTELLPGAIEKARARWPDLEVRIRRAGARRGRELLDRGEIDFAVMRAADPPDGLATQRLCRDRMWVAIPEDHPLATGRRLELRAIAREPLVSFGPTSFTRRRVMDRLAPLGGRVHVEVEGKQAALRWVQLGLGIAFLSLVPGHRPPAPGVVLRDVTRRFPTAWFWAAWRPVRTLREPERLILDALERPGSESTRRPATG